MKVFLLLSNRAFVLKKKTPISSYLFTHFNTKERNLCLTTIIPFFFLIVSEIFTSFSLNIFSVKKESHTIGVEFGSKIIDLGGKLIKLQVWRCLITCIIFSRAIMIFYLSYSFYIHSSRFGTLPDKNDSGTKLIAIIRCEIGKRLRGFFFESLDKICYSKLLSWICWCHTCLWRYKVLPLLSSLLLSSPLFSSVVFFLSLLLLFPPTSLLMVLLLF